MKFNFKEVFSRIAGFFIGAISGILAGFLEANHWLKKQSWDHTGDLPHLTSAILYFLFLPGFISLHLLKGAFVGATQGLRAAFFYPVKIYNQHTWDDCLTQIDKCQSSSSNVLLSSEEEQQLLDRIDQSTTISDAEKQKQKNDYQEYKEAVKALVCPITKRPLDKMQNLIVIHKNNAIIFCEADAFKKLVLDCQYRQIPVSFSKRDNPKPIAIIHSNNISSIKMRFLPEEVSKFIERTRKNNDTYATIIGVLGASPSSWKDKIGTNSTRNSLNVELPVVAQWPNGVEQPKDGGKEDQNTRSLCF
ncbi:hypothetical protein [Legionella fairfieldensis]|uniref:hypothetical protein n=1 Tax=Legionella fairfieldensis TaxID=45064 RepID=UPI000490A7C9|nr:hypothetical protein [Legionella fairfieldensis]